MNILTHAPEELSLVADMEKRVREELTEILHMGIPSRGLGGRAECRLKAKDANSDH